MDDQRNILILEQDQKNDNDNDYNENIIINLKKFQIKKITKSDIEKEKKIEMKLSELMDNKIKYGKDKKSHKLYIIKNKKVLVLKKVKPTPYQLYENIKKEILSKSVLKVNDDKINHSIINPDLSSTHPLRFKKIVIKKKGMLSGSKYSFFPYIKKNKKNEEKKVEDSDADKNNHRKSNSIYDYYIKNVDNRSIKYYEKNNKLSSCFTIERKKIINSIINKKYFNLRNKNDFNNKSISSIKHSYSKILPKLYHNNSNTNFSSSL